MHGKIYEQAHKDNWADVCGLHIIITKHLLHLPEYFMRFYCTNQYYSTFIQHVVMFFCASKRLNNLRYFYFCDWSFVLRGYTLIWTSLIFLTTYRTFWIFDDNTIHHYCNGVGDTTWHIASQTLPFSFWSLIKCCASNKCRWYGELALLLCTD